MASNRASHKESEDMSRYTVKQSFNIKQNSNKWELWIRVNNQYSQVFRFDTEEDANIAMQEAIAVAKERLAQITTISDYFKVGREIA